MKYFAVLFFSLFCTFTAIAQDKYTKHKVGKGETITEISKKYKVTPHDIFRLNPDSQNGIKENTILLIPSKPLSTPAVAEQEKTTKVSNQIHTVLPKETLYSLSKKYKVSVEEITNANAEELKAGLQQGQKLIIPIKGSGVQAQAKVAEKQEENKGAQSYMFHTVAAGETKYSIAKQYGMSLQLLEELNPEVKDTLSIGVKLKLSKNALLKKELGQPSINQTPAIAMEYTMYTVQPKETFYSLTRRTGLTQDKILELNPEAREGLKDGMQLRLPLNTTVTGTAEKHTVDLTKSLIKSAPKEIALLLPFNIEKIGTDSIRMQRLRTDKFLNMTLDFYAGALVAIDSAAALGIPLKVRILDSDESKNASAVASFKNTFSSVSAVIGPFFQENVDKTAAMLTDKNIPVISPLSKEAGSPYSNLYQSVPSSGIVKMAMLNYLKGKAGNVVAVVDAKKTSSRDFIKQNYAEVRFLDGAVTEGAMRAMLATDRMNYIILESESTSMILNTTRVLTTLMTDYKIQLVVLEKYNALDHAEIPLNRLTALKMLYPSVTKSNHSSDASIFEKNFRRKNNIFPNQFATRGFDVTFDVILRLFQEEGFSTSTLGKSSEQVENRFDYEALNGGNYNNGVYILQYNDDLTLTTAE